MRCPSGAEVLASAATKTHNGPMSRSPPNHADAKIDAASSAVGTDGGPTVQQAPTAVFAAYLAPAQSPDEIGRLGSCRLLRKIGEGGMGFVFEAEDVVLKRRVAVKVMRPEIAAIPGTRTRFLREAQAAAALRDDHVVPMYHVGEEKGVPYLVMPFLPGESLQSRLKRDPPLTLLEAVRYARQTAQGLAAAHAAGLVHRDIKPGNLWLEEPPKEIAGVVRRPRIRILDFGLARIESDKALTRSGQMLGTPAYMAPEQARGAPVDFRADLFSLGSVLYHLTAGQLPFQGSDVWAQLFSVVHDAPKPPQECNPVVPAELAAITLQLLSKDPEQRPDSAASVVVILGRIEKGLVTGASASSRQNSQTPVGAALVNDRNRPSKLASESPPPRIHRRLRRKIGLAAGLAGLALASFWVWWGTGSATPGHDDADSAGSVATKPETSADVPPSVAIFREAPPILDSVSQALDEPRVRKLQREWAKFLGRSALLAIDLGGTKMEFVLVPPGEFLMGSSDDDDEAEDHEKPQHRVRVRAPFYLGRAPVTKAQFAAFCDQFLYRTDAERDGVGGMGFNEQSKKLVMSNANYSWRNVGWSQTDAHPVLNVTYSDAAKFCRWLQNKVEDLSPHLPSEAQWEYAARAGSRSRYFSGDDPATLLGYANVGDRARERDFIFNVQGDRRFFDFDDGYPFTSPVGQFKPNALDLYDMAGNVWQWCEDWYDPNAYDNPIGNELPRDEGEKKYRVIRGSSWCWGPKHARCAFRECDEPNRRTSGGGFRVALRIP
jgi:formylglycine-generating enzyme required for sulfatase activity/serine/threonine protein kinase